MIYPDWLTDWLAHNPPSLIQSANYIAARSMSHTSFMAISEQREEIHANYHINYYDVERNAGS